jgi:hypothetical protein
MVSNMRLFQHICWEYRDRATEFLAAAENMDWNRIDGIEKYRGTIAERMGQMQRILEGSHFPKG